MRGGGIELLSLGVGLEEAGPAVLERGSQGPPKLKSCWGIHHRWSRDDSEVSQVQVITDKSNSGKQRCIAESTTEDFPLRLVRTQGNPSVHCFKSHLRSHVTQ